MYVNGRRWATEDKETDGSRVNLMRLVLVGRLKGDDLLPGECLKNGLLFVVCIRNTQVQHLIKATRTEQSRIE